MKTFKNKSPFGLSQYVQLDLGMKKMLIPSGQVAIGIRAIRLVK